MEQIQALSKPPPEHPKIALNLVWTELQPFEKAQFAQIMGYPEMAQMEMQAGGEPAHITKEKAGIEKIRMKGDTDLMTEAIKAKKEKEENDGGNSPES
jgi:hypothetical protein